MKTVSETMKERADYEKNKREQEHKQKMEQAVALLKSSESVPLYCMSPEQLAEVAHYGPHYKQPNYEDDRKHFRTFLAEGKVCFTRMACDYCRTQVLTLESESTVTAWCNWTGIACPGCGWSGSAPGQ